MQIEENTLHEFTPPQIVAFIMWELTYLGFDEKKIEARVKKWDDEIDYGCKN